MSAKWPPRWMTPLTAEEIQRGEGDLAIEFINSFGKITKDSVAGGVGEAMVLRDWQQELIRHLFAHNEQGYLKNRIALVGMPRKSGKSALASAIAMYHTVLSPSAEVYSLASEKEQARIVFGETKKMFEQNPELMSMAKMYRDAIEIPETGSVYRVRSAESASAEGYSPTAVIYDELHTAPNRELFDVFSLAMGARKSAQMIAITTAGVKQDNTGQDSIAYNLYNYGKRITNGEVEDDSFYMAWWEGREDVAHTDEESWHDSNPGLGDISSIEDMRSAVRRTPEAEFRTKRLNQWVNRKEAWLPAGAWSNLAEEFEMTKDDEYVLGFDGSWKNDSTALVAVIMPREEGEAYRVKRVASWEKDFALDDDSWVVDKGAVTKTVMDFFDEHPNCREMACDPAYWEDEMYQWNDYGIPVVEYRNSVQRTVPATSKLYEAIMNGKLKHDGDAALARHLDNCVLKIDNNRGARITKDYRNPKLKIDLAIALLMAYDRATSRIEEQIVPEFFV